MRKKVPGYNGYRRDSSRMRSNQDDQERIAKELAELEARKDAERKAREEERQEEYNKLVKDAENGDIVSQFKLYELHKEGLNGVKCDVSKSIYWLKTAAESGHIDAMFILGLCYCNGDKVDKNIAKGLVWLKKSAEQDHKDAMLALGYFLYSEKGETFNPIEAYMWLDKADKETSKGIIKEMLSDKDCVSVMIEKYEKEALAGDIWAMNRLAYIYVVNKAYPNAKQGFYWYKKAAELGNINGQRGLGACYQLGVGTKKDLTEALKWYEKANAIERIKKLKSSKAWQQLIILQLESKANSADSQYMCQLGMWYQYGENELPKDMERAIYWYQKAAMAGNTTAISFLNMLLSEKDVERKAKAEAERKAKAEAERKAKAEAERKAKLLSGELDLNGFEYLGKCRTYTLQKYEVSYAVKVWSEISERVREAWSSQWVNVWLYDADFDAYMNNSGASTIYRVKSQKDGTIYQLSRGEYKGPVGCKGFCPRIVSKEDYWEENYKAIIEYEYETFNSKFIHKSGTEIRLNV